MRLSAFSRPTLTHRAVFLSYTVYTATFWLCNHLRTMDAAARKGHAEHCCYARLVYVRGLPLMMLQLQQQ